MDWDDLPVKLTVEWYEDAYGVNTDGWALEDVARLVSFLDMYESLVEAMRDGEEWMTEAEYLDYLERYGND